MTSKNIDLVKNSWALVAALDMETVGGLFYNRLFEIAPEVKPMFSKTTMPEQSERNCLDFFLLVNFILNNFI